MQVRLPPRLYKGFAHRVVDESTVQVRIELDFGVHVNRTVRVEGMSHVHVPPYLRSDAIKTLITLVGGKDVFVLSEPTDGETILGRLYVASKAKAGPEHGAFPPPGLSVPMHEVTATMLFLSKHGFAKETVFALLNGHLEGAA